MDILTVGILVIIGILMVAAVMNFMTARNLRIIINGGEDYMCDAIGGLKNRAEEVDRSIESVRFYIGNFEKQIRILEDRLEHALETAFEKIKDLRLDDDKRRAEVDRIKQSVLINIADIIENKKEIEIMSGSLSKMAYELGCDNELVDSNFSAINSKVKVIADHLNVEVAENDDVQTYIIKEKK